MLGFGNQITIMMEYDPCTHYAYIYQPQTCQVTPIVAYLQLT